MIEGKEIEVIDVEDEELDSGKRKGRTDQKEVEDKKRRGSEGKGKISKEEEINIILRDKKCQNYCAVKKSFENVKKETAGYVLMKRVRVEELEEKEKILDDLLDKIRREGQGLARELESVNKDDF